NRKKEARQGRDDQIGIVAHGQRKCLERGRLGGFPYCCHGNWQIQSGKTLGVITDCGELQISCIMHALSTVYKTAHLTGLPTNLGALSHATSFLPQEGCPRRGRWWRYPGRSRLCPGIACHLLAPGFQFSP